MKQKSALRSFLLIAGSSLLAISSASAGDTWDGGGANNLFSTPENWDSDTLPTTGPATFVRLIGNTQNVVVNDLPADTVITTLNFQNNGTVGYTNPFTLSGNRLVLTNIQTFANSSAPLITDQMSLDIGLNSNLALTINEGHDLIISGLISQLSGSRSVVKDGAAALTLTNANTFTNALVINKGTVNAGTIFDGGTASNIGAGTLINFNANNVTSVLNYTGAATNTNRTIVLGGTGAAAQAFENLGGRINNNGSGALVFTATNLNSTTSVTASSSRTIVLGGANTDANTIQGVIRNNSGGTGNLNVNLTKEDAGLWILSASNTYTGLTTVNGGTLLTTKALALPGYNAASRVTVASGATLGVRVDAGGWTAGEINTLLGATPAAFTAGSNLGIDITTGSFTYATNIGITQAAKGLVKFGAGTLVLSVANTYAGNTTVEKGILRLTQAPNPANANSSNDAATVTIAATGATLDLTYTGTDIVDKLFIGGVQQAAGVYGPSATSIPQITNSSGSGTLTVTSSAGIFSSWIAGTFAGGATVPNDKRGANDDPDGDGIRNLVEYAIAAQDPTVPNPSIGSFAGFTLSFAKRSGTSGLTYAIQESTDLGLLDDWTEVSGGSFTNNPTMISYTLPGTDPKSFLRLRVSQP